jgi:hypothetical protein
VVRHLIANSLPFIQEDMSFIHLTSHCEPACILIAKQEYGLSDGVVAPRDLHLALGRSLVFIALTGWEHAQTVLLEVVNESLSALGEPTLLLEESTELHHVLQTADLL